MTETEMEVVELQAKDSKDCGPTRAWKRPGRVLPSLRGRWPCRHLDSGLLASSTMDNIHLLFSLSSVWCFAAATQEINTLASM